MFLTQQSKFGDSEMMGSRHSCHGHVALKTSPPHVAFEFEFEGSRSVLERI